MIEFVHQRGLVSANDDGNGLKRKEEEETQPDPNQPSDANLARGLPSPRSAQPVGPARPDP